MARASIIDNWTHPATNGVELAGTNWLGTNIIYDLRLEMDPKIQTSS